MRYIERDLKSKIIELNKEYSAILITGARQVGKSTLFETIMKEQSEEREVVTLDDLEARALAKKDPAMFLQIHEPPVMIDEVQYAPELFSYIKIAIDKGAAPGSFWLTGSQAFKLMDLAQESLAGRVAILRLPPLSQHEAYGKDDSKPFAVDLNELKKRKKTHAPASMDEIYERIWMGGMPGLISGKFTDRDVYYSSYIQTYIERDVSDLIQGVDKLLFRDFIRSAASRIGEVLNIHAIAGDVGINDDTAKRWLQVLEKSEVITLLRPYSNNLLHRTIKTPKLYFFDTGLVAYLTKYSSPEILANGALAGHILENYVVMEIIKSYKNAAKDCLFWYYRDKDNKEVDMILESDGMLHPIEVKRSVNPGTELVGAFSILDRATTPRGCGAIICMRPELSAVDSSNLIVPVWYI
ncbi:ATP-binding protein [Butyrivibrio sp. DSM 10294]|uniref:ATP-binding protein n=1 Tax=Butyrivibrio sp. DSM 10294 TaxID=2972457 RepID=UPI00234EF7C2|nr:ATP-binding protein [Butyrivibrio sp. DSM 10294]MDC7293024.1 ATP-binding protein [Butyrivibrio sp. DSM 10294]